MLCVSVCGWQECRGYYPLVRGYYLVPADTPGVVLRPSELLLCCRLSRWQAEDVAEQDTVGWRATQHTYGACFIPHTPSCLSLCLLAALLSCHSPGATPQHSISPGRGVVLSLHPTRSTSARVATSLGSLPMWLAAVLAYARSLVAGLLVD